MPFSFTVIHQYSLKALPLTLLLSLISNKEVLFILSANKVADEEGTEAVPQEQKVSGGPDRVTRFLEPGPNF